MPASPAVCKKRGPKPKGYVEQIHVMVPVDLKRWVEQQPEDASALVRRLITQERDAQERARRQAVGHA